MATFEPKMYPLKDGSTVMIRVGETSDAAQLIENANHFVENGEGQVLVPGELKLSLEDEYKWIENHRSKPTNLLLVADRNGKLLGHIDFYGASRKRLQHTGHFGMGVRLEARGLGVGRALLSRLIDWAKASSRIERINLQVLGSNAKAIGLYSSLGFVEDGRKHKEIKLENGTYIDDISMSLALTSRTVNGPMTPIQVARELWLRMDQRNFESLRELLHREVEVVWPQSSERICGPDNFIAINANYPGEWRITVERADEIPSGVVSQVRMTDGKATVFAISYYEFKDGLIFRGTEYWSDSYPAPGWRARWVTSTTKGAEA